MGARFPCGAGEQRGRGWRGSGKGCGDGIYDEFSVHCDIQSNQRKYNIFNYPVLKLSYKFDAMSKKPRSKAEGNDWAKRVSDQVKAKKDGECAIHIFTIIRDREGSQSI